MHGLDSFLVHELTNQLGGHAGAAAGKGRRLSMQAAPSMDTIAVRFKTWLQDFF